MSASRTLLVFLALLGLTALELVVSGLPVGPGARITALTGLALTKGVLVLLAFMHLRGEPRALRLTVLAPLLLAPGFAIVLMLEAAFHARAGAG